MLPKINFNSLQILPDQAETLMIKTHKNNKNKRRVTLLLATHILTKLLISGCPLSDKNSFQSNKHNFGGQNNCIKVAKLLLC